MTSCVYYVVAGVGNGQAICVTEQSRSQLCESLIGATLNTSRARAPVDIVAYCVDELWVRAVLQVANAREIHRFFRLVSQEYETRRGYKLGAGGAATFFGAIQSVRLNAIEDQLSAVRHCHLAPIHLGLVELAEDWRWGSHRSYLGLDHTPGLHRSAITSLLAGGPGGWPLAYRYLLHEPDPGEGTLQLPTADVPILPNAQPDGDRACLKVLFAHPRERGIERILKAVSIEVCDATGCDPDEFMEAPSERRFRLQRALLLEEFTVKRPHLISVNQLARCLHSDRSWLYQTRKECRLQHPDLFTQRRDSREDPEVSFPKPRQPSTRGNFRAPGGRRQWSLRVAAMAYHALGVSIAVNMDQVEAVDISALLACRRDERLTALVPQRQPPYFINGPTGASHTVLVNDMTGKDGRASSPHAIALAELPESASNSSGYLGGGSCETRSERCLSAGGAAMAVRALHVECRDDEPRIRRFRRR